MITYNHRPYIEHAVDSILSQKADFGVELVIGEDHSKDGTREFVLTLPGRYPGRVRLVLSDDNVGMHENLHRTELACRGKYLAYCEGDDFWNDPTKLAKQVAFLERRSDYSMVHSHAHRHFVRQKRAGKDLVVPRGLDDSKAFEDMLLGRRPTLTVTVLARAEHLRWVVERCPECTDPKWPMGDTQRFLELARLGKVGCIHEPLATTNYLPESATQSHDPGKRLRFFMAGRELKLQYLAKYPVSAELDRAIRQKQAWIGMQQGYEAGAAAFVDAMYVEFVTHGGRPGQRARWLRWGSRSNMTRRLAMPALWAERKWRNSLARLSSPRGSTVPVG
jgi:glycosyltransferase involved in cell wall biosynthesis